MEPVTTTVVEVAPGDPRVGSLARVFDDLEREELGPDAVPEPPGHLETSWRTPAGRRIGWVAVAGEEVVGAALMKLSIKDNLHIADVELAVDRAHRRRGHGRALVRTVLEAAEREGRGTVLGYSIYRPEQAQAWQLHERAVADPTLSTTLDPGTGPGACFARSLGAVVVQTELRTQVRLPLGAGRLEAVRAETAPRAAGYRTVTWSGEVPAHLLPDRAELARRMSTDPPLGDIDWEEEVWDPARVEEMYADRVRRDLQSVGAGVLETATGRLVAFSEILVHRLAGDRAWQEDTIVLPEHRGHRLGMVVKAANLEVLQERYPGVQVVQTWNALENGPMVAVNRALGFEPVGLYPVWQLTAS